MHEGFDKELELSINENQRLKSKVLAVVFLCIFIIQVLLISTLLYTSTVFNSFTRQRVVLTAPFAILVMSLIEFYMMKRLSIQIKRGEKSSAVLRYTVAFLETSFPTIIFLFISLFLKNNPDSEVDFKFLLNSPPVMLYFIFIILSALQLDFRLCLFVSVVSAIEFFALSYFLASGTVQGSFYYSMAFGKSAFFLLGGIMSGIVAVKIRESVLVALSAKNDLIFNLDRMVKEKTMEIAEKNILLEEKNKDIMDSINYAQRIQQARLPVISEISSTFPDSFVLYKPKDIVSGDFYFFHQKEKSVVIAAADCTGHGVPGALMSMIGSEKLEDAVIRTKDPSEMLMHLNKTLKQALRQSGSITSTRDGMDIALCSVNIQNRKLRYAGANRPLWIVRQGSGVIEEIRATKKAIGGLTDDSDIFEEHEFDLRPGDTFYICTDGYADQFSGLNGKKLMTKKFKEILISIQDKSMNGQKEYLESFIEEWKSGTEQVDDILVIGVKL
jgi:serine phosphatase RsbU (regulator of sigma subunit)